MRPELFALGSVYAVPMGEGFRFVQHVGMIGARPVVVVLDVLREDRPFPEELDDVGPQWLAGPALFYFVIDGGLDPAQALFELPIRWVEPGKRAPSLVRFSELGARIARELAAQPPSEVAPPSAPTSPTLLDDDGVLIIGRGAFAAASDSFAYPHTLLAARAAGQIVFFESGDEGTLHIEEGSAVSTHRFVGVLEGQGPSWVMPLSRFTQGPDGDAPTNVVSLSPHSGRCAVHVRRHGATVEIVRTSDSGARLGADEIPSV